MKENMEQLGELVTREVLRAMGEQKSTPSGGPAILVIGPMDKVPAELAAGCRLAGLEEYKCSGSVQGFEKLCVTALSLTELADIALGRDSRPAQCAVLHALLEGKEVQLLESALPHRGYSSKGSPALYQTLEGYVRTLERYGVRIVGKKSGVTCCPSGEKKAAAPVEKVITEAAAARLAAQSGEVISIPRGTVVTPSAKDVFLHSGKRLEYV